MTCGLAIAAALAGIAPSVGRAAPGDLDATFGDGGVTLTTVRSRRAADANDVIRTPDGKFIVTGVTQTTGSGEIAAVVARYSADGELDASFASEGIFELGMPGGPSSMGWRAAPQSGERVVFAVTGEFHPLRLTSGGMLDVTFGTSGFGPLITEVRGFITLADDRIIAVQGSVTGWSLMRLLPDGAVDTTFNSGGGVPGFLGLDTVFEPHALTLQPDGKLLVAGRAFSGGGVLVRANDDGTPDGTFGMSGVVTVSAVSETGFIDVAVAPGGDLVAVGGHAPVPDDPPTGLLLARFHSDGSMDGGFGAGGFVVDTALEPGLAVEVQANGRIVVVGGTATSGFTMPEQLFQLLRYEPMGTPDGSFGTAGIVTAAFSPLGTYPARGFLTGSNLEAFRAGLLLQPDGRIVVVGQKGATAGEMLISRYEGDCGNGVLDPNEACDDGNLSAGDCCTRSCTFESAGTRCATSGDLCTNDVCDPSGTCLAGPLEPAAGCTDVTVPQASSLVLKDVAGTGDLLTWKWRKGDTVALPELGDPTLATAYAVCLYEEGGPTLLTKLDAPAGGMCGSPPKPCWTGLGSPSGTKGFLYRDPLRSSDGLDRLLVKPGVAPKPQVSVTGKGPNTVLPALPLIAPFAVRVQLKNSVGLCFEARFTSAQTNTGQVFSARSE